MAAKKSAAALDVQALAHAVGLGKAAKQFPDEIQAAVQAAVNARNAMPPLDDVVAEPWPPMRMRSAP